MKQYLTYDVRAVEFDGDDGLGMEHLSHLLREVADQLDGHAEHIRTKRRAQQLPVDNITYDLAVTLTEDGLYKAMLYVFNDE